MYTAHFLDKAQSQTKAADPTPSVLTIGNFDGFHLGHQAIFDQLSLTARELGYPAYVVTFEPNPKQFFKRETAFIQTPAQRLASLRSTGVCGIYVVDFGKAYQLSGAEFIQSFLIEKFNIKHLVVGENFRLGKDRSHAIDTLCETLHRFGIGCHVVKPVLWQGKPVSSSRIRDAIRGGDLDKVSAMLGRDYTIDGRVVSGEGIGREIGYPTINLKTENTLLPKGVFVTRTELIGEESRLWGVTSIGNRPTMNGQLETVETHLHAFSRNLYGVEVRLSFFKKLRDEFRYDTVDLLKEQIATDILQMQQIILSTNPLR